MYIMYKYIKYWISKTLIMLHAYRTIYRNPFQPQQTLF